jgi:hypothetical protein
MKCRYSWLSCALLTPALALGAEPDSTPPAAEAPTPAESSPDQEAAPAPDAANNSEGTADAAPNAVDTEAPVSTSAERPSEPAPPAPETAAVIETTSEPEETAPGPQDRSGDLSAPDTLGGHVRVAVLAQVSFPAGNIAIDVPTTYGVSTNFQGGLDVAYGVSRLLTVGVAGDFQVGGSTTACPSCKSDGIGGSILVRHHLTQGLRFDPWLAFGVGLRSISVRTPAETSSYLNLEWLRLQVGGDFFATPNLGFGPLFDFALSSSVQADGPEEPGSVGVRVGFGLRAVFDVPGRGR